MNVDGSLDEREVPLPAATEHVSFSSKAWPYQDLSLIDKSNSGALALASELVDFHKNDFAGAYVDEVSTVHVAATTDEGYLLAQRELASAKPSIKIDVVPLSISRASDLGLDLYRKEPSLGPKIYQWEVSPATGSLRLGLFVIPSEQDRQTLEIFAAEHRVEVDVYVDTSEGPAEKSDSRLEDDAPYAGGFRYTKADGTGPSADAQGWCSGGFGYKIDATHYMLTAGHCIERDTTRYQVWNTYSSCGDCRKVWAGQRYNSQTTWDNGTGTVNTADGQKHGDLSIVNLTVAGDNAGTQIWWNGVSSPDKIPVTARKVPTLNDPICINGVTSGADCGLTIVQVNTNHTYSDGDVLVNGDAANSTNNADCSQDGDSGGSVVLNHPGVETQATAVGIVSGRKIYAGTIGCAQFFTGVEEAIQAWGGNVRFN